MKDKASEMWFKLFSEVADKNVNSFCISIKSALIFSDFILELAQKGLICIEDKKLQIFSQAKNMNHLSNSINIKNPNYEYFENILNKSLINNNYLTLLYLNLNYECNLNCLHCFISKSSRKNTNDRITFDEAKKIINEAYSMGLNEVCLTGGECTLNKDFFKISEYIRKKRLALHILTNGQILYENHELYNNVIKLYPTSIQISLYSMTPEIHDKITTVKGSHNKTINIVKKLISDKINVKITCFQTRYNFGHDIKVKEFSKSVGASFLTDTKFINNCQNDNISMKLTSDNIEEYYINHFDIKRSTNRFQKDNSLICNCGIGKLSVTPSLDINPCNNFNYILGNYHNISLKHIRNVAVPQLHNLLIAKKLNKCFKYDYCKYCNYCPVYIENFNDKNIDKSNILCEDAKAYQKALEYYLNKH